jgi:hypothetical protein
MPSVRDQGQPSAGRNPTPSGHAYLEAGTGVEMPVVPNTAVFAAGAPD